MNFNIVRIKPPLDLRCCFDDEYSWEEILLSNQPKSYASPASVTTFT